MDPWKGAADEEKSAAVLSRSWRCWNRRKPAYASPSSFVKSGSPSRLGGLERVLYLEHPRADPLVAGTSLSMAR